MAYLEKEKKSFKDEICGPKTDTGTAFNETRSNGEEALIVPPDGGWGWIVVVASFVCNFIVDGIIFSGGILLKHIQLEFDASEKEVALVNSLLAGFYLMAGPFVAALANKYGFRIVTIVGSLISVVGFVLSYFATSIVYLYLTYGIIGGIGFCMIYMPAVVVIGFYFEKWRGLATGLALCGSGVGTFVLAPFTDKMVKLFGWRITVIIHAVLVLLCVLCGAVFRPIKPINLNRNIEKNIAKYTNKFRSPINTYRRDLMPRNYSDLTYNRNQNLEKIFKGSLYNVRRSSATHNETKDVLDSKVEFVAPVKTYKINSKDEDNMKPLIISSPKVSPQEVHMCRSRSDLVANPLYRNDMFYSGSLKRLPEYSSRSSFEYHLAVIQSHCDNEYQEINRSKSIFDYLRKVISIMLDVSLFKSVTFIILTVSGMFTMMGLFVPYMFVPQRAEENGVGNTASVLLVSTMGIANIIGRIASGLISTAPKISSLFVYNVALTIGGIATMTSGLCYHEVYQFTYCVIFGLSIACFASLRSILVVEYIGLDKLTNCFGLFLLFQGVGALIGAPIAGALKDLTGDYDAAFYVSGGFLLLSAVVCYPVQCVHKWEKSRKESCETSSSE